MSLLHNVVTGDTRSSLRTVPNDLQRNKRILNQCKLLLNCVACSHTATFITLAIVLCEKISLSYAHIINQLTVRYNQLHPESPYSHETYDNTQMRNVDTTAVREQEAGQKMQIREYEVDVEEEPCIYGGLVAMQLRTVRIFLHRLRELSSSREWSAHVVMLEEIENSVAEQLRICGSCAKDD